MGNRICLKFIGSWGLSWSEIEKAVVILPMPIYFYKIRCPCVGLWVYFGGHVRVMSGAKLVAFLLCLAGRWWEILRVLICYN